MLHPDCLVRGVMCHGAAQSLSEAVRIMRQFFRSAVADLGLLRTEIFGKKYDTPATDSLFSRWRRCNRANVAMIFGLSLVPVILAAGSAIDVSRALVVRSRLSQALDAAGLAVGGTIGLTEAQTQQLAQNYFDANYPAGALGVPGTLFVSQSGNIVSLSATATLNTMIMSIVGIDTMTVGSAAEITRESRGLEVALVLDNTGSMYWNGKIGALRNSATSLINILFGENAFPENLKVSLVPFVTSVNIRASSFDMDWMDVNAAATHHGENFDESGGEINHFDLFDGISNTQWKGCVELRAAPYDTEDTAPDIGNPDTLWVPYFWPDEPSGFSGYHNSYRSDGIGGSPQVRQANAAKYNGSSVSIDEFPSSTRGPNKSCPQTLLPLTNDRDDILDNISQMRPWFNSGTNIAAGLAWGWRILSPTPPFSEGVAYDDEDWQKAIVLLTDGRNEVVAQSTHNVSDYTGYGYLSQQRLGTQVNETAVTRVNERVAEMCTKVKAQGIRVYTITFQLSDPDVEAIFDACATDPALHFRSPTNAELEQAFQAIAQDLSNLRLSQ